MKLIFQKIDLINSINISLKAISPKITDEGLSCIHIRAYEDIYFTTSNTELWIKTKVIGKIEKQGEIGIKARFLSDLVKKLPNDEIIIELISNNEVSIKSGDSNFKISCIELKGYNDIPHIDKTFSMNLNGFNLKEMIRKTIFCTSQSENMNILMSGEFIEIQDNKMKMTALDGSRIAICSINLDKYYDYKSCIVPSNALTEVSKIVKGETDEILEIIITDNHMLFNLEDTTILTRLISGTYFDISKMLSQDYELKIDINKNDFMSSVDRSLLLIKESDNQPLIIKVEDDFNLSIKSKIGEMNENLDIIKDKNIKLKYGVNPKFLLEALKAIDDENINLFFINKVAPFFIKDEEESYIYVLLPINFIEED